MPVGDSWAPVIRAARQLNKPIVYAQETWHEGRLSPQPYSALNISADNIMLSACKRSEDGTGLVLRLYETDGKETPVTVSGDLVDIPLEVTFSPWSMRTYFLADGAAEWKEVLITEFDM
jgi:alpha-mannosidase